MMIVALNMGGLTNDVVKRYPQQVHLVPMYTTINSRADSHADIHGNQEMAAGIAPWFGKLVQRVCTL